ncbi:MAG TPA: 3-isopropylmalate dehydrogenase [Terriglobales bacterium]|nr:3-isopropylmalate dehydrogenase [Terriglobales bacterium]
MPELNLCLLPGDGIGPEVTDAATAVLGAAGKRFGFTCRTQTQLIGGAALRAANSPLPDATRAAVTAVQAVLLGAVGSPEFDREPPARKPETGLLGLRKLLGCWANLRPLRRIPGAGTTPVREEIVAGTDLIVLRELTGGLYFGEPRGFSSNRDAAFNTLRYSVTEIERLARFGFELARQRRHHLTSVDKANVLEVSQLWRETFTRVALDYPDVTLDHMYVDNCAMQLILRPTFFDVLATANLFGDILSDETGVLAGSLGLLPSASLGGAVGLYEPVHGSAPDLAGKGVANPVGAILSAAMLLRHSFQLEAPAAAIEHAVTAALQAGVRTRDLAAPGTEAVSTAAMTQAIIARL